MAKGYPDYEGGKSGLYLMPEWAAREGLDKNITVISGSLGFLDTAETEYIVPIAKTLYIVGMSFGSRADAEADADKNQMALVDLTIDTQYLSFLGGNGGNGEPFNKPMVFAGETTLKLRVWGYANHNIHVWASCWGYEVVT